ncbi:MAG: hypothetical protein IT581_06410 [Verrucomicrobiales bacterium]|nr:hypothetical protein [Verrucomicrobiales bacterium]
MLYVPSPIATGDIAIAQRPYLGGEFAVYYSFKDAILMATIALTGATAGTFEAEPGVVLPADPGAHLQMALLNPFRSAGSALAVGVSAKGVTTATLNGTATFAPPAWVRDATANQPLGAATDVVTTGGEKFIAGSPNLGLGTIANGVEGTRLGLFRLPESADWVLLGCTGEIRITDKSRKPKNIACGMNQSAFTKPGQTEIGSVSIGAKARSFQEGLLRIRGQRVAMMIVGKKEDTIITDRIVLSSVIVSAPTRIPEGDGEVVLEAEGQYEDALYFGAPSAS